jgi:SnoaL-like domain
VSDQLDDKEVAALRRLLDREAIVECVINSCRGIDRGDEAAFRSAYHPDAVEDHGSYVGDFEGLVEFLRRAMSMFSGYQRYVSNFEVDIDGDQAHVESYYMIVLRQPGGSTLMVNGGRYLDRLERRDGRWGIVARVVISEWGATWDGSATSEESGFIPARMDKEDLSYQRPLQVARANLSR